MRKLPIITTLWHALNSTRHNLAFAFHMTWPWMLLLIPLSFYSEAYLPRIDPLATAPDAVAANATIALKLFVIGIITLFALSSIAVSWHRYILADKIPQGWQRLRFDAVVWRYFGNTVLIALTVAAILALALLPIMLLAAAIGLPDKVASYLIFAAALIVAMPLAYRMMMKLPAIAMSIPGFAMKQALEKTKGNTVAIGLTAGAVFALAFVIGFIIDAIASAIGAEAGGIAFGLAFILKEAVGWVLSIFSVTLLTSLYGFFIEGREF